MFSRDAALLAVTFLFIFGWKVTPTLDLVLVSSAGLALWVLVFQRARLGVPEAQIVGWLAALSAYSLGIATLFGAADAQAALRSMRALVNFLGGVALAVLYLESYGERARERIALGIYLCVFLHAALICAMFASPGLRTFVYALASTFDYVNVNAPVLLGLRIPGLTYGLASTSVVQLSGLLLVPLVLREFAPSGWRRLLVWASVLPVVVSIFLTGRTGLLFAILFLPVLILFGARARANAGAVGWSRKVLPLAIVFTALAVLAVRYGEVLQETFAYTLARASELLELLDQGGSETTRRITSMFFLPEDPATLLFGSSNLGRGELAYIPSDVGYIKLIFAVGLLGLLMNLMPYLVGMQLALRTFLHTHSKQLALAAGLCLLAGLLLNFKELALLTRNQWSIQSLLIAACALQLRPAMVGSRLVQAVRHA